MSTTEQGCSLLAELPLLPRDDDGPVFAEPWQAQAFAMVAGLIDSQMVSREEWAERLGAVLKEAEERGEYDTGVHYYDHWLVALEGLVVEKGFAGLQELTKEKEEIAANDHHRREHQLGHEH
jgi:nitrile hydratase accessory protein